MVGARVGELRLGLAQARIVRRSVEAGEDITMPTFSHRFADFLGAFQAADLMVLHVREWVGRDFGPDAPHKITRRGADWPWLVDWTLTPGG